MERRGARAEGPGPGDLRAERVSAVEEHCVELAAAKTPGGHAEDGADPGAPQPERPALGGGSAEESDRREDVAVRERKAVRRPRRYKVLLHNDDFTAMDFVIEVLVRYFGKSRVEATRIMLEVHHRGMGVAGVFTFEVAETKVAQVTAEARQHGMPLKCTVEAA